MIYISRKKILKIKKEYEINFVLITFFWGEDYHIEKYKRMINGSLKLMYVQVILT